jgi:hypothetical protein
MPFSNKVLYRQSPAAFYVYSTVKVITAAAITDDSGNLACGTTIGGFPNMNQNAQAYFGGPPATPVIISLTTPFIYQPARGQTGAVYGMDTCFETPAAGTEDYGYVPQTVLDFLISNKEYSSQYPGLSACLPGGPSIIPSGCGTVSYFTTTFTTTPPPSIFTETSTSLVFFNQTTTRAASTFKSTITIVATSTFSSIVPPSTITPTNSVATNGNLTITFTVTGNTLPTSTFFTTEVSSSTTTSEVTAAATTAVTLESSQAQVTILVTVSSPAAIVTSVGSVTIAPVASTLQPPAYVPPTGGDLTDITVSTGTPLAQQQIQTPGAQSPGAQTPPVQNPPAQIPPDQTPPGLPQTQ